MSTREASVISSNSLSERSLSAPIRPRVFHIVSPLTGSKATIITTDTTSSPNHAPVLIQAAQRINRPILNQNANSRKRVYPFAQESDANSYLSTLAAHRHRERLSKGLRYFSKKVCNKVQEKKITSYNEVATELVAEYTHEEKRSLQLPENELAYEQKNIRRRVYDAINVLLAMNIIIKDKKDIRWVGFPVNALFESELIDKKIIEMKETIREKVRHVEEALLKQIALRNLIRRNEQRRNIFSIHNMCSIPFFVFGTSNGAAVETSFSRDGRNTVLTFDRRVNIKNETECLHKLGLSNQLRGEIKSEHDIKQIRSLLPETFQDFATEMATTGSLKTLFESRTSTKKATSSTNFPPICFKVEDDIQEVDDEEFEDDDDEILSPSSDEEESTQRS